ncbi:Protein implicated in RNA metabolism containing PRC-barrel domain [Methanonatronarchaeum thermophilum]|uniref:Protein implicated in RNA metabolism containing PRC-barrel domain n=1 Tax=Methanonatronarchaeum thermophilum TaxID=1927129 RepID=A0A1Y3G9H1_9EURY|nr:PRC-barrel domain-containing protein [Methanonatronarchaeum thermophilum]OUJ18078.1 Protein implicated in RNA metabolism containing PRC-barrel domain [Methanonatronarchaeum thermophilum]
MEIPVTKLSKKDIVSSDGDEIGSLYNVTMNMKTGELLDLIIEPHREVDPSNYETQDDYIVIPFQNVKAIKDMIVVEV